MFLIPTRRKDKLPKTLSYPLGAALLSERLQTVPQLQELQLSFCSSLAYNGQWWRNQVQQRTNVEILVARYWQVMRSGTWVSRKQPSELLDYHWTIEVYPIPREKKQAARQGLLEVGLPYVQMWLSQSRPETRRDSWQACSLSFDLSQDYVSIALQEKMGFEGRCKEVKVRVTPPRVFPNKELPGALDGQPRRGWVPAILTPGRAPARFARDTQSINRRVPPAPD